MATDDGKMIAKALKQVNPGREALAMCIFESPCHRGARCEFFHANIDCEPWIKTGNCSVGCKKAHVEIRRHYHVHKAPLASEVEAEKAAKEAAAVGAKESSSPSSVILVPTAPTNGAAP